MQNERVQYRYSERKTNIQRAIKREAGKYVRAGYNVQ